jgi:hypothetical protein
MCGNSARCSAKKIRSQTREKSLKFLGNYLYFYFYCSGAKKRGHQLFERQFFEFSDHLGVHPIPPPAVVFGALSEKSIESKRYQSSLRLLLFYFRYFFFYFFFFFFFFFPALFLVSRHDRFFFFFLSFFFFSFFFSFIFFGLSTAFTNTMTSF